MRVAVIIAAALALTACSSSPKKPKPSVFNLSLHWTEPTEYDTEEPLAEQDLQGYRLECRTPAGALVSKLSLTPFVQRANIRVRAGTYHCRVFAQAIGVWSDPSNEVIKVLP